MDPAPVRHRDALATRTAPRNGILVAFFGVIATGILVVMGWTAVAPEAVPAAWRSALATPGDWRPQLAFWLALVLAFTAHWWPRRRQPRAYLLVFGSVLVVIGLVMGTVAYWDCSGRRAPFFAPLTWAFELFTGSTEAPFGVVRGCPTRPPAALDIAQLATVVVVFGAFAAFVLTVFRPRWDRLRARYARARVLVIAPEASAVPMLQSLQLQIPGRTQLTVVVDDLGSAVARAVRQQGWPALAADSVDEALLRALVARGGRVVVRSVYVLGASPGTNADWVGSVESLLESVGPVPPGEMPKIIVRIDDPWFAEDWRRSIISARRSWVADAISAYEETARGLLERADALGAEEVIIAGDSPLTLAVLGELAQRSREARTLEAAAGHKATGIASGGPRAVIVGGAADETIADHVLRQRRFGVDPSPGAVRAEVTTASAEALGRLADGAEAPVVILSGWPDVSQEQVAIRLAATSPDLSIFHWRAEATTIETTPRMGRLVEFGVSLAPGGHVPLDNWERIARLLHEAYIAKNPAAPGVVVPASRLPWDDGLPHFYKESNLRQLQTLLTANASLGRSWGPAVRAGAPWSGTPHTPKEIEILARAEHESWLAFYRAHGWQLGAEPSQMRHPAMREWDSLREEDQRKTRDGVSGSIALLASLGYVSTVGGWSEYERIGTVQAQQSAQGWTWRTGSGSEMSAKAGDWRVVGEGSEAWSVADRTFRMTYERIADDRYRRVGRVRARRATTGESVSSPEGRVVAGPGDMVVEGSDGARWIVPCVHFERAYRIASPP